MDDVKLAKHRGTVQLIARLLDRDVLPRATAHEQATVDRILLDVQLRGRIGPRDTARLAAIAARLFPRLAVSNGPALPARRPRRRVVALGRVETFVLDVRKS